MDTSEKYIKMCDCPEIQDSWVDHHWGDFVCYDHEADYTNGYTHAITNVLSTHRNRDDYVWLPRQDQLQDMVDGSVYQTPDGIMHAMLRWMRDPWGFGAMPFPKELDKIEYWYEEYIYNLETREQLWLAFVMYKKHNKTWNGEQWNSNSK